jgi:hypothetical protein
MSSQTLVGMVKWRTISLLLSSVGLGIYLHDRAAEWVTLGQRLHGIDVGFSLSYVPLLLWTLKEELGLLIKPLKGLLKRWSQTSQQ